MQPPGTLVRSNQQLSLDDFDYGYFDYDRPRHRTQDDTRTGLQTSDSFTVLPPVPRPAPSPPPAPTAYRLTSPIRRQKKASFVILTNPQSQLPGSARSIRVPLPGESKNLPPPGKSRIPRSQPVSREPSPSRKRYMTQQRRASVSNVKNNLPATSKPSSPKNGRKTSVKRQRDDSIAKHPAAGEKDAHPSPSRIPRPSAAKGSKSPAPSREPSPARKNSKVVPQKKGPSTAVNRQQTVLRKNSNLKPLAGKPPLPPASKGKPAGAEGNKSIRNPGTSARPGVNKSKAKTSPSSEQAKTESKPMTEQKTEVTESSPTPDSESFKNSAKPQPHSSTNSENSQKSTSTRASVNLSVASIPTTNLAPAISSQIDQTVTSSTSELLSTDTPDTSSTLVSTTTAPSLELAKPSSEPDTVGPTMSSSADTKTSATCDKSAADVAVSLESVRSTDSVDTVRAASSPHPKKKATADEVATSETIIKGDPDLESLSPNALQQQDSVPELLVAETSSSVVESVPKTTQSRKGRLLSRLCPSYSKFSICFKKLNCCECLTGKSISGSKVGIIAGSKAGMIGSSKVSVEEGSRSGLHPSSGGKCGWLKKFLCCSRRGEKCCTCCRKKADSEADGSRRRSNATSRMSKKQSRSSSTAVEPDNRPKLDSSLVESGSMMRGAIPVLPVPLAWFCLLCNIFVPGLGTLSSGFFCLCFGKPRFGPHDDPQSRMGSFVLNALVGAAQLFTVIFCLVGWGWSIWWGVITLRIARKYRKLKLAAAANAPEDRLAAPITQNHDIERGNPAH